MVYVTRKMKKDATDKIGNLLQGFFGEGEKD